MIGESLKSALNLEEFPFTYIQKVIGIPMTVFVVTFDSRRPMVYLSVGKVKKSKVTTLGKIKKRGFDNVQIADYRLTPPVLIENTNPVINSSTLIVRRDIGAEYWLNTKMYENYNLNCEVIEEIAKIQKI